MHHAFGKGKKVKVKVYIYRPDIHISSVDFKSFTLQVLELTLSHSNPLGEYSTFSAAEAIRTAPIFIPPGTHYCWVDRDVVDSKLVQGFHT